MCDVCLCVCVCKQQEEDCFDHKNSKLVIEYYVVSQTEIYLNRFIKNKIG